MLNTKMFNYDKRGILYIANSCSYFMVTGQILKHEMPQSPECLCYFFPFHKIYAIKLIANLSYRSYVN